MAGLFFDWNVGFAIRAAGARLPVRPRSRAARGREHLIDWIHAGFAAFLLASLSSPALDAADAFSWRRADGEYLLVKLCRHPFADAIIDKLPEFEGLTGIKVAYAEMPESGYLRGLEDCLNEPSGGPDVFMADVQQVWRFAGEGRMADLDGFIADPSLTRAGYAPADFFERILGLFRWSGAAGDPVGAGPLWAVPLGFGTTALIYNRGWLARRLPRPPETREELLAAALLPGGGPDGMAIPEGEGADFIRSAYFPFWASFGAVDLERVDGRLIARVNSPESVAATAAWLELPRRSAPLDRYESAGAGGGCPAMLLDMNSLGYYLDSIGTEAGSDYLAFAPPPFSSGSRPARPAIQAWGLSVNPASERREAAWLFAQYFTGQQFQSFMSVEGGGANPSRRSIAESPSFQEAIREREGYAETLAAGLEFGFVPLTPTRLAFGIAERWAGTLRGIESGAYPSVQAGLDDLNRWIDSRLGR